MNAVQPVTQHRFRRRIVPAIGVCVATSLVLAACGGGSSSGSGSSGSSGGKSSGSSGSFSLSKPVKLGLLFEVKGESSVANSQYEQGATLAVDEINAAGGVGGQKIQTFRVPSSPLDPQKNLAEFLKAVQEKPSAMIGLAAPTQAQQLGTQITRAQIPVIITDTGDTFDVTGTTGGSQYSWFLGPYNPGLVDAGINYLVKDLKKSKVGLMGTNESYGNGGISAAKASLSKSGLKPFAVAQYSPVATDLTQQVLAMKGADAAFDWGYPNPLAVQLNQFIQNGIDIPTMAGVSIDVAISGGLVKGQALANAYATEPCNLINPSYRSQTADFAQKFKAKYGVAATQNSAWAYDGVNLAVAAIKAAKSDSPAKVNDALKTVDYKDSVCAPELRADGAHVMAHEAVIVKYDSSGGAKIVKQSPIADVKEGG